MNYMKQVAEMLGVELGEEFMISDCPKNFRYRITHKGLEVFSIVIEDDKWEKIKIDLLDQLLVGRNKIIKLPKSILTEEEKEDLSGIIRLFRDEVISICKFESMRHCGYEFLSIKINNNVFKYETTLPYFKKWAMYKGMKLEKEYSLEELGL